MARRILLVAGATLLAIALYVLGTIITHPGIEYSFHTNLKPSRQHSH